MKLACIVPKKMKLACGARTVMELEGQSWKIAIINV